MVDRGKSEFITEEWDRPFVERLSRIVGESSAATKALKYADETFGGSAKFYRTNRGTLLVLADDKTQHS